VFACGRGGDRLDEASQGLVGVGGSAAVALVVPGGRLGELGGDGLGRAVVGGSLAGGAIGQAARPMAG
jgi:hypothetical protein